MKYKEYKGTKKGYENYKEPEQKFSNQEVNIRLYCAKDGCSMYIKGILGYNGGFTAETGQTADLRNQEWRCNKHFTDDELRDIVEEKLKKVKNEKRSKYM